MKQLPLSIIAAQQKFKDWRAGKLSGEKIPNGSKFSVQKPTIEQFSTVVKLFMEAI